jgi:predicted tellurium resistance membrane protein TerC
VQLATLFFLEIVLGVDNLVFIAITTDRLPDNKKHIGRRLGLGAALVMRIIFLSFASWVVHLQITLFTLPFTIPFCDPAISIKDLVLFVGGAYLVIKGISEVRNKLRLKEEMTSMEHPDAPKHKIGLAQATLTIMVMDIIFSIDSVITAVGMVDALVIMIIAVILAVLLMMVFADPISEFINKNPEVKLLALVFIIAVGLKLVAEALGIEILIEGTDVELLDVMLYFAMGFSLVLTIIQMVYNKRLNKLKGEIESLRGSKAQPNAKGDGNE